MCSLTNALPPGLFHQSNQFSYHFKIKLAFALSNHLSGYNVNAMLLCHTAFLSTEGDSMSNS